MKKKFLAGLLVGALTIIPALNITTVEAKSSKVTATIEQTIDNRANEKGQPPEPPKDENGNPLPPPEPPKDENGNPLPPPEHDSDHFDRDHSDRDHSDRDHSDRDHSDRDHSDRAQYHNSKGDHE